MQPVTEPVGAYGAPVGGGMLPGPQVEEEYEYARRDRRPEPGGGGRTGTFVLLAIAILLVAGLAAYTISRLSSGADTPTKVAVPSVVGQGVDDATKALQAKGFTNIVTTKAANDAEKDTVFAQDPPENTSILKTDKITLSVSTGPGEVTVPSGLKGKSLDEVRQALTDAGLDVGTTTTKDEPKLEQNQVVSTEPAEGSSVAKGSKVNLVLATGNVVLPQLRNKTLAVAYQTLNDLGLKPGDLQYQDAPADAQPNVVVRTDPGPGTVKGGSTVVITVTKPGQPTPTPEPSDSPSPSDSPPPTP